MDVFEIYCINYICLFCLIFVRKYFSHSMGMLKLTTNYILIYNELRSKFITQVGASLHKMFIVLAYVRSLLLWF